MKADLHLHSKYSDRPSEWFLRRIGAPESFVDPLQAYRTCRDRGMDVVTLTDHNSIEGALRLSHLPDTFLSVEATTYFPDDGCKIHCLAHGITEAQFADIQKARENIYDLQGYLADQGIAHTIAHPFFRVNERLTVDHVEKLLLLFDSFELINGSRHDRAARLIESIFSKLTPDMIDAMAERQGIAPRGVTPWRKSFTGGSDDHSGVYAASAFTETPDGLSTADFLAHLGAGRHRANGTSGTSLRLAHSLYHIAYDYYSRRLASTGEGNPLIASLLRRIMDNQPPDEPPAAGRFRSIGQRIVQRYRLNRLRTTERELIETLKPLLRKCPNAHAAETLPNGFEAVHGNGADQRAFQLACRVGQQIGFTFLRQFMDQISKGRLIESLQAFASLGPVALSLAPYLAAFKTQHKDELFFQQLTERFPAAMPQRLRNGGRAWFTDTFTDVNGVAYSIRTLADILTKRGNPVRVMTALDAVPDAGDIHLVNFTPIGRFTLPEYEALTLSFPPFLEIIEYLERERIDETLISTPGPLGLTALAAARLLGLKTAGFYHTDLPRYVRCLTDDDGLEPLTWKAMLAFYGQMDRIYVPSQFYLNQLIEQGFDASKLRVLPRGVDTQRFHPAKRDPETFARYGLNGGFKYLYVGRVSREKNIELLLNAFRALPPIPGREIELIVVGDGPDRERLEQIYRETNIVFTGYLHGEALARAYAAADVFVFPSETDTFGNVVLEAQASGLPAIVADRGGPPEIVMANESGLVVPAGQVGPLTEAMQRLAVNTELRARYSRQARITAQAYSWDAALANF